MKPILLYLFSFMGVVLTQVYNRHVEFAATGPVTHVCPGVQNASAEMFTIVQFLITKSFDSMMVRMKSANFLLIARLEDFYGESSCLSTGTNRFFYCNLRGKSVPLDAHILNKNLNLRRSIVKGAFVLKKVFIILEAQKFNGTVSIQKAGAVVDGMEEGRTATDLNKTDLTDWMGVVFTRYLSSVSCTLQSN